MTEQSSKEKGNLAEEEWASLIKEWGLDPDSEKSRASGAGQQKSDVDNSLNYIFEVKNVEKLNIFRAEAQAERYEKQTHAIPSVPHKRPDGGWWISIPAWEWAALMELRVIKSLLHGDKREARYKVLRLKTALKDVEKLFN